MIELKQENCGTEMTQDEVRKIQLEMLDAIVKVCDENNLKYYLSGGTLLGAIRHKGYIPWDDDIDINMPRPDINKLLNLCGGRVGEYQIFGDGKDPYRPENMFYRLYNMKTITSTYYHNQSKRPIFHPLFVDIFPIDGFPKSKIATEIYCQKLIFLKRMIGLSCRDFIVANRPVKYILSLIMFLPAKIVGYKNWANLFSKLAQRYSYETSEYVGVTSAVHYHSKEKVVKEEHTPYVEVEFEGKKYKGHKDYDKYLGQLYGNYMEIPPIEKQNSGHDFRYYWRKER